MEFEQAIIRVIAILAVLVYLLSLELFGPRPAMAVGVDRGLILFGIHLVLGMVTLEAILHSPAQSRLRVLTLPLPSGRGG